MKNFKIIYLSVAILATGAVFSSCANDTGNSNQTEKQGKEYTSAYVCEMHCEGSGSDEPGKCPVCGMDYVENKDHKSEGHNHDEHEGHNH